MSCCFHTQLSNSRFELFWQVNILHAAIVIFESDAADCMLQEILE